MCMPTSTSPWRIPWLAAGLSGRTACDRQATPISGLIIACEIPPARIGANCNPQQVPGGWLELTGFRICRARSTRVKLSVSGSVVSLHGELDLLTRLDGRVPRGFENPSVRGRIRHGRCRVITIAGLDAGLGGRAVSCSTEAMITPLPSGVPVAVLRPSCPCQSHASCYARPAASPATAIALSIGYGEADPLGTRPCTATFRPIIWPSMFNNGPPELPGLMLASV